VRDAIEGTANSKAIGEIPEDKQVYTTFEDLAKIAVERRAMVKEMLDEVLEVLDEGEELSEADIEYLAKATGMEEEGIKSWCKYFLSPSMGDHGGLWGVRLTSSV
jgi:rRNA maturation endonuclease Nob1